MFSVLKQSPQRFSTILGLIALLSSQLSVAAPITFYTALPVAKDEFLMRQQFIRVQSGTDPSGANKDRSELISATALAYGIDNQLSIFAILPYKDISLSLDKGGKRVNRSNTGFGDMSLFARYIFDQKNEHGKTLRWAAFAGVKAPTGDDVSTDKLGLLPAPVQTGTGSWDTFAGLVVTRQTLSYQVDAQISYRLNSEANNSKVGDVLQFDASLQKRIWPTKLTSGTPGFTYAVLEMNWIKQQKNSMGGVNDNNSGGTRLLLAPGVQYVTRRWIAEAAIQIPVQQNLNGNTVELDRIVRAGVRFNF